MTILFALVNDGCVIARFNEAKSIGMGEPYFKIKGTQYLIQEISIVSP